MLSKLLFRQPGKKLLHPFEVLLGTLTAQLGPDPACVIKGDRESTSSEKDVLCVLQAFGYYVYYLSPVLGT